MSTRRQFLQHAAATAALTACSGGRETTPHAARDQVPAGSARNASANPQLRPASAELHFLKRLSFGPTSEELQRVRSMGEAQWLAWQLAADSIDDSEVEAEVARRWPSLSMSGCELAAMNDDSAVMRALRDATMFRRVFSQRQLFEVMVDFWSDHFTIYHGAGIAQHMKTVDDREVIRAHALGQFRDMLHASARSPAMLEYLDNRRSEAGRVNENYGRELLELHTLGVDGGYTEADVFEVARALTGWRVVSDRSDAGCINGRHRSFEFRLGLHDQDEKWVLGTRLPAGRGIEDGNEVLNLLVDHPATRRFIASKLYRRFVRDRRPPASWVDSVAAAWGTDGDIAAMLRVAFLSSEFRAAADEKMGRPQDFALAAIRALRPTLTGSEESLELLNSGDHPELYQSMSLVSYAREDGDDFQNRAYEGPDTRNYLIRTGQVPFQWPAPNGYPTVEAYWASVNGMAERWQFGIRVARAQREDGLSNATFLAGEVDEPEMAVDHLSEALLMRPLDETTRATIVNTAAIGPGGGRAGAEQMRRRAMALLLASPYAQRR